jgi:hypothetical protein
MSAFGFMQNLFVASNTFTEDMLISLDVKHKHDSTLPELLMNNKFSKKKIV